jgi:hypothetical protein
MPKLQWRYSTCIFHGSYENFARTGRKFFPESPRQPDQSKETDASAFFVVRVFNRLLYGYKFYPSAIVEAARSSTSIAEE